jgi:hypothetical protein
MMLFGLRDALLSDSRSLWAIAMMRSGCARLDSVTFSACVADLTSC